MDKCPSCQKQRPTLDPVPFRRGYDAEVKPGYEVARKYPSTLDRIHCFCECRESPVFKHKTLLSCFTETHAAGCGICLKEATLAGQLKDSGYSDEQAARRVETTFRTDGHPPTMMLASDFVETAVRLSPAPLGLSIRFLDRLQEEA